MKESGSEVFQSCLTLCNPMDCNVPGSSVHGILQVRIMEWVAISFPRGSTLPRDQTCVSSSCSFVWMYWQPTPVFLPGESHGQRILVGCSTRGCKESDMTERLHFDFSLSCFGEGNGNPLQCSCLENPRHGEAW